MVNISRIEVVWKILIAHFDILANCKVQTLRQLSLEALLCIILEIFGFRKEQKKQPPKKRQAVSVGSGNESADDTDVDENWSGTVWQYTILTPFSD